ncbi:hypothetical protein CS022_23630 [Veronia nyctiphanis]|uniref:Uncharacterized protein n=2 Tax=Veronia nyctiphanis TaxID=1278244 RepID=A0A4Q0YL65_9GAMM|nr:hypothetical protein CS022_23630 [Veronia nyctiphanis]
MDLTESNEKKVDNPDVADKDIVKQPAVPKNEKGNSKTQNSESKSTGDNKVESSNQVASAIANNDSDTVTVVSNKNEGTDKETDKVKNENHPPQTRRMFTNTTQADAALSSANSSLDQAMIDEQNYNAGISTEQPSGSAISVAQTEIVHAKKELDDAVFNKDTTSTITEQGTPSTPITNNLVGDANTLVDTAAEQDQRNTVDLQPEQIAPVVNDEKDFTRSTRSFVPPSATADVNNAENLVSGAMLDANNMNNGTTSTVQDSIDTSAQMEFAEKTYVHAKETAIVQQDVHRSLEQEYYQESLRSSNNVISNTDSQDYQTEYQDTNNFTNTPAEHQSGHYIDRTNIDNYNHLEQSYSDSGRLSPGSLQDEPISNDTLFNNTNTQTAFEGLTPQESSHQQQDIDFEGAAGTTEATLKLGTLDSSSEDRFRDTNPSSDDLQTIDAIDKTDEQEILAEERRTLEDQNEADRLYQEQLDEAEAEIENFAQYQESINKERLRVKRHEQEISADKTGGTGAQSDEMH